MLNTHLKDIARKQYLNALAQGILVRASYCSACGKRSQIHGHHEDYAKPEVVIWLCYRCHRERHVTLEGTEHVVRTDYLTDKSVAIHRQAAWNKGQCRKVLEWR